MAVTEIATTNQLTVKEWAAGLEAEALKKISVMGFTGRRSNALVQMKDELEKGPGDQVTIGLRRQLSTAPKDASETVEGNELALDLESQSFVLDEFADAVRWKNVTDRQRVTFEMRDEARAALADLLANAWDTSFFNQIAGVADPGGATTFEGNNAITAPSASHQIISGDQASEAALTATDIITLDDVSLAVQTAKLLSPTIRPAEIPGYPEPLFVLFVHPWQNFQLRQADSRWEVILREAIQGGMIGNNPLITGALGIWDGVLLCENSRVPASATTGVGGITVRRSVLCGAQAAFCCTGRLGGAPDRFRWVEKLFDYDRQMGVLGGFVAGIVKSRFDDATTPTGTPVDFATIVISSASTANDT